VIECVVNISEGRDQALLAEFDAAAGESLLDRHTDPDHHRSVFTLVGTDAPRSLAALAVERLDLGTHQGAHPRIGVVDVVPFVALGSSPPGDALAARDAYARWSGDELQVPCFTYGPERTLPEIRRSAFGQLRPDTGPDAPHPTAGASAVGQRGLMVAYNVWLADADLGEANRIAKELRSPAVRALGLRVGDEVQVSMNLVDPARVGPAAVFDAVAAQTPVARAELVGLVPRSVLDPIPRARWRELDVADDRTIEARLEGAGLDLR
jgi:glutamate formiminotransferase / 5-formyltetrahydrofolate cyclo-ligase